MSENEKLVEQLRHRGAIYRKMNATTARILEDEAAAALTAAEARIKGLEEAIWLAHDQLNTYRGAAIEEVLTKFEMYIPGLSGQALSTGGNADDR